MISFIFPRNGQGTRNWLEGFNLVCALSSSVAFSDWKQRSIFFKHRDRVVVVAVVREGSQILAALTVMQHVFRKGKKTTKAFPILLWVHQYSHCLLSCPISSHIAYLNWAKHINLYFPGSFSSVGKSRSTISSQIKVTAMPIHQTIFWFHLRTKPFLRQSEFRLCRCDCFIPSAGMWSGMYVDLRHNLDISIDWIWRHFWNR